MVFGGLPFDIVSVNCSHPDSETKLLKIKRLLFFFEWKLIMFLYMQLNVIGQCLGFLGSGLYAYYKLVGK